jgi:hypothetical protein
MTKMTRQQLLNNFFSGLDIEFDDSLTNFQKYSVSANLSIDQINTFSLFNDFDIKKKYSNLMYNELINSINSLFRKNFTHVGNVIEIVNNNSYRDLDEFLLSLEETNIITNSYVAALLMDSLYYSSFEIKTALDMSSIYKYGSYHNKNVSIDPYMKYNDTILLSYDKIKINLIIDEPVEVVDSVSFNLRTILPYKIDFKIINPKVNYLISENTSSEVKEKANPELVRKKRDKLINKLIYD